MLTAHKLDEDRKSHLGLDGEGGLVDEDDEQDLLARHFFRHLLPILSSKPFDVSNNSLKYDVLKNNALKCRRVLWNIPALTSIPVPGSIQIIRVPRGVPHPLKTFFHFPSSCDTRENLAKEQSLGVEDILIISAANNADQDVFIHVPAIPIFQIDSTSGTLGGRSSSTIDQPSSFEYDWSCCKSDPISIGLARMLMSALGSAESIPEIAHLRIFAHCKNEEHIETYLGIDRISTGHPLQLLQAKFSGCVSPTDTKFLPSMSKSIVEFRADVCQASNEARCSSNIDELHVIEKMGKGSYYILSPSPSRCNMSASFEYHNPVGIFAAPSVSCDAELKVFYSMADDDYMGEHIGKDLGLLEYFMSLKGSKVDAKSHDLKSDGQPLALAFSLFLKTINSNDSLTAHKGISSDFGDLFWKLLIDISVSNPEVTSDRNLSGCRFVDMIDLTQILSSTFEALERGDISPQIRPDNETAFGKQVRAVLQAQNMLSSTHASSIRDQMATIFDLWLDDPYDMLIELGFYVIRNEIKRKSLGLNADIISQLLKLSASRFVQLNYLRCMQALYVLDFMLRQNFPKLSDVVIRHVVNSAAMCLVNLLSNLTNSMDLGSDKELGIPLTQFYLNIRFPKYSPGSDLLVASVPSFMPYSWSVCLSSPDIADQMIIQISRVGLFDHVLRFESDQTEEEIMEYEGDGNEEMSADGAAMCGSYDPDRGVVIRGFRKVI